MSQNENTLKGPNPPNIECIDKFGNTALHCASYRRQKEAAVMLLQNGINPAIKNNQGQTAAEMARTASMRQILDVQPVRDILRGVQRFEGALLKRSRLRGWKSMWAVLERGVLTYFNSRGDATTGVKRKGFKYLDNAKIKPEERSLIFTIVFSDSTKHTLAVQPETTEEASVIQLHKWMNNLGSHIAYSTHYINQGTQIVDEDLEDLVPLGTMEDALQTAQAHQMALERHITNAADMLEHVEQSKDGATSSFVQSVPSPTPKHSKRDARLGTVQHVQLLSQFQQIGTASKDMCNALTHCMTLFKQQEELRKVQLQQEMEKTRVLQEALHALATEHHELEHTFQRSMSPARYYDTDDDEFYDCDEGEEERSGRFSVTDDETTSFSNSTYSMAPEPNNHKMAPQYKWMPYTNWGGSGGTVFVNFTPNCNPYTSKASME
ncbi:oxysterol-binding protein-related protein 1 [Lingula anatina]|uniref:Oxysterol-binding protein-related protein 1 n=1 Tax=Lingula anatina TaxID=7574 RepID=A0A1S3KCW4_LINAN|nr:oxysterol-binding protein-related protein 1 [Lingula anatina]|eukprot:XP_013420091.1 oxysterol-binding protein-related protein 1 [Lingula anatina]